MIAFIWERLVGLKVAGVEVTLAQFTLQIESTLATALSGSERQYFSGDQQIFEVIDRILKDENIELLEINLRNEPYWWDTRLFLQAALIEDYTNIQRIVFVDDDHRYVGMAAPRQVRRSLADAGGMNLEEVYQQIANDVRMGAAPKVSDVHGIVDKWSAHTFKKDGRAQNENEVRTKLSARPVEEKIPQETASVELVGEKISLETASVECDEWLESADVPARVLMEGARFVPVTRKGRLLVVVNVDAFAATQILGATPPPPNQAPPGGPQEPLPPNDNVTPPRQGGPPRGHDQPWQGPPQPGAPPYYQPPLGWNPPPPPLPQAPLPQASDPPPPP